MPDPLYIARSEVDPRELREMLAWFRQQRQRRPDPYQHDHEEHPAPEVYIARTSSSGIPALSQGALTGTGSLDWQDDVPGWAECDIFRVVPNSVTGFSMERVDGLTRTVFNLSNSAVPGNSWITLKRDKAGTWIASSPNVPDDEDVECPCDGVETSISFVSDVRIIGTVLRVEQSEGVVTVDEDCCPTLQVISKTPTYYDLCVCDEGPPVTGTGTESSCCTVTSPLCVTVDPAYVGCDWPTTFNLAYLGEFNPESWLTAWEWSTPTIDPFDPSVQFVATYTVLFNELTGDCFGFFAATRSDDASCNLIASNLTSPCTFPKTFGATGFSGDADITITEGICDDEDTGTEGPCSISRSSLGTISSLGLSAATLTMSVTVEGGTKLMAILARPDSVGSASATFNGVAMTKVSEFTDLDGTLEHFLLAVVSTTTANIVFTPSVAQLLMAAAVEIDCVDGTDSGSGTGSGQLDAGDPTVTVSVPAVPAYVQGSFLVKTDDPSFGWASPYAAGQSTTMMLPDSSIFLLAEGYAVPGAAGTSVGALTGITAVENPWIGLSTVIE